jgi:hypothetical protein
MLGSRFDASVTAADDETVLAVMSEGRRMRDAQAAK